jgi:putative ABC transport system ATP-binding protein
MKAALNFDQISKTKITGTKGKQQQSISVLRDITFAVNPGEIFAILGPSGAGKSTILRLINRLEDPKSGTIYLNDQPIQGLDIISLRRKIGMVFQLPALFDDTVEDNIGYGLKLFHNPAKNIKEKTVQYLEMVGLSPDLLSRPASNLSVGQQQRVSLARTLAIEPEVLLMDEPTSALDPSAVANILNLIKELNQRLGLTILFVTHTMDHAQKIGNRGILIVKGEMVEQGLISDMFNKPQNPMTKDFIAGKLKFD